MMFIGAPFRFLSQIKRYWGDTWGELLVAGAVATLLAHTLVQSIWLDIACMVLLLAHLLSRSSATIEIPADADDRFTRACVLIDAAMSMVDEDEARLLRAFMCADEETRLMALDAMGRVSVSDEPAAGAADRALNA